MKHLLTILILTLVCSSASAPAQTSPIPEKAFSGFAVRFQIRDDVASFEPIIGSELEAHFSAPLFMSRANPPSYNTQISLINLFARRQGEEWDVSVTVTLPKDGGDRVLAVARLKEGDKLKVDRFTDYDLRPSEVSIVKIDPVVAQQPTIVNLTSSIEVSKVQTGIVPVPYRIFLKNISPKPVQALEISVYRGKATSLFVAYPEASWDHALIEAAATYEIRLSTTAGYQAVAANEYRPTQNETIQITTVVFADGTFEGRPARAEWMAAQAIGNRIQLDRTLSLIATVLESSELNTAEAPINFRRDLLDMSGDADRSYTEEIRNRFPMFDEETLKSVDTHVGWGLEQVRSSILADLRRSAAGSGNASFRQWLIKEQEKCKTWRSRVS